MTSILEVLGKRALLKAKSRDGYMSREEVSEFRVLEVSPSGNWVKLMSLYGNKFWKPVTEVSLVEVLHDLRPEAPPSR